MDYTKLRKINTNKKAAIELSIGTVVVIVIAMSMLILGVVLVRNIFSGATSSVNSLNDKVRSEIASLFTEEGEKIVIYGAGADRTIKVKRGTDSYGFVISALAEHTTQGGTGTTPITADKLKYKLELREGECNPLTFKTYFKNPPASAFTASGGRETAFTQFDDFDNPIGDTLILLSVPDDAETCTQSVRLFVQDSSGTVTETPSKTFSIQIVDGGIFS